MYNYLKRQYALHKISKEAVYAAVGKGLITADQYESITGEEYE